MFGRMNTHMAFRVYLENDQHHFNNDSSRVTHVYEYAFRDVPVS